MVFISEKLDKNDTLIKNVEKDSKSIGDFTEKIDFSNDPNMYLFYKHMAAGLLSFTQQGQTPENSISRYKSMLRVAEGFIGGKFGVDFIKLRKDLESEGYSEADILLKEIEVISFLLNQRSRKVNIILDFSGFSSGDVEDEEDFVITDFEENNDD